jgi:hypothetical protein
MSNNLAICNQWKDNRHGQKAQEQEGLQVTFETYRCLYCKISIWDAAEWLEHLNSEEHRNSMLNRHKVQRDPGDENPLWQEPDYD